VTRPASGGTERGTRAPSRSTGMRGAVGAVVIVLALGLALRLIIAYLLPGSGFGVDLSSFRYWASNLADQGPWGFYGRDFFHDYTPGYLYVLWLVGLVGKVFGGVGDLIKVPPIVADLAIGWLVHSMILELGGRRRLALAGALVAVLNPVSWFDSVVWGQVDSFGVVFLLLGLRELWRDRPERAAVYTVIAAIIKPQLGILIPLVAIVTIRRALQPAGGEGDPERTGNPRRILTTGLAGFATAVLLAIPFGLTPIGLIEQVAIAGGGYPYLSVNAYNPWALVPSDTGVSLANAGQWVCDAALGAEQCGAGSAVFGIVPAIAIGTALLVGAFLVVLWAVGRRPDRLTLLVGLAVLALAFFVLPTRVHERYGYPFFALAVILAAVSPRWRVAYVVLSAATFANMYVVLTTLYTDNPSISDWLGIGPAIRSEAGVIVVVLLHVVGFVWAALQLRSPAHERLEDELDAASEPDAAHVESAGWGAGLGARRWTTDPVPAGMTGAAPAGIAASATVSTGTGAVTASPAAAALASRDDLARVADAPAEPEMPTWSRPLGFAELGVVGWFRERLGERAIRPDRSASLRGEGGGRLDRLDVWFLAVLIVASLTLRIFRLPEPYQMHFDEVYHARTATEFLQDWRYGLSHDIYEYTHPHLAKYAMALGIMAWGEDDVSATSDLGVPVRAAAVEPRSDDETAPGGRSGERLHVATGSEIRTYDLRSRALISTIAAPGVNALALDPTGGQLVTGFDDGRVAVLDLAAIGPDAASTGVAPVPIGTVTGVVDLLYVTTDGATVMVGTPDHLDALDLASGTAIGGVDLPGLVDIADGGNGATLIATTDQLEDPAAEASVLAEALEGDAAAYEEMLRGTEPTVLLGNPGTSETRADVEKAIADGKLPGIEIQDVARVAAATADGVTFVDPTSAKVVTTVSLEGGAHGMAEATGLDDPYLYVTSGTPSEPTFHVVVIGGDDAADGPIDRATRPLPGPGTKVVYDDASQMIHILGLAPDAPAATGDTPAGPWTVYVVEPHANAVYADARLAPGMVPVALAADVEADDPSGDRQQLLVLDGGGAVAAIEIGSHAFAWRLPGVILGAVTIACLYLLGRILFRRRMVAALVGVFVLADGMFFVQSRIGMNDIYVGTFILAAYTVFAAVWTGWWRSRAAFWVAMPLIGGLLGLALASKWVGLYAIGSVVLLILARSALGRVLAILGLVAATGVLGYMAMSVPEGQGFGNLVFLVVMIALTLIAVVVAIVHPIAWTDDEMRFAVIAPVALGALVFFGALALGRLDAQVAVGGFAMTPLRVALLLALGSLAAYVLFSLAGRFGFGPLAAPPGPDDPAYGLEPPAPPPDGWLRPGWLLGLPVVWMAVCLAVLPIAVYVASYIPWAMVDNHQIVAGWPPGHTGQTLLDLTGSMYNYHNTLSDAHPASSPWWAWPLDLKPVWFYQEGLAAGTSAAIYDAGNLVIWWLGVPALLFVCLMAFRRRSLGLALIAIGFAAQWIPWARIDRAAFQYHYYTALPFVVLSLAYFIAELWHGASRATWRMARIAGAAAIVLPAAMWLFSRPLCAIVGVESVNPGSQACPAVIPDFVLTSRTAGLAIVAGLGCFFLIRAVLGLAEGDREDRGSDRGWYRTIGLTGAAVALGLVIVSLLPDAAILTLTSIPVEPLVLLAGLPLGYLALGVIGGRDPRRYVVGFVAAAVGWFAILYPNIAALPLPGVLVNAYQGIVPTYLYAFQFPVSKVDRTIAVPLFTPMLAVLFIALAVTCLVVAYSAWVWRLSLAARADDASEDADGFVRSGGA
jgi:predicted membrane-bound dolichyl-phosphate-mannose-protein mannosyltransferase